MPDIPHEYTVRGKATAGVDPPPVEWHDWFVEQVRRHGYKGKWGKRTFRYLEHGGWKFWVIGEVINRERLRAKDDAGRGGGSVGEQGNPSFSREGWRSIDRGPVREATQRIAGVGVRLPLRPALELEYPVPTKAQAQKAGMSEKQRIATHRAAKSYAARGDTAGSPARVNAVVHRRGLLKPAGRKR
jgi:hypothetical protein